MRGGVDIAVGGVCNSVATRVFPHWIQMKHVSYILKRMPINPNLTVNCVARWKEKLARRGKSAFTQKNDVL